MTSSMNPSFTELRTLVEAEVHAVLDDCRRTLPDAAPLLDELAALVDAGGKRLRPALCYWGFRAGGGAHGLPILRIGAGLELLHTFALVHDDIMDASDERRGRATAYASGGAEFALLAGDLSLVLADEAFLGSGFEAQVAVEAFGLYSAMRREVIAGQWLDFSLSRRPHISEADARRVARMKSGRYSVEMPLAIGATLARAPAEVLECLQRFGAPLGEAFQLCDDLLGTFGDRSVTGKPVDSDIREGKRHVLYAKALALLEEPDRTWLMEHWGKGTSLTRQEIARARALLESSGAKGASIKLLDELVGRARAELGAAPIREEARPPLRALMEAAVFRTS